MFKIIDPFATGMLPVTDGNKIYWETSGNPNGKPSLYLHGGPGGGITSEYRRHFDPELFLIVSFEQRGCGRSRPKASDPGVNLLTNTTQILIDDIEKLRTHLNISDWLIIGFSWGTTLALAYAQAHPNKVTAMVLAAVTMTTSAEVEWITEHLQRIFPREWNKFATAVQPEPGERIIDAYYRKIQDSDQQIRIKTALAWCEWEDVHLSLDPKHSPNPRFQDPEFCLLFSTLVTHYWKNSAFLGNQNLLEKITRIIHLPCILIHGRLDISSPLITAWNLHQSWPGSELVIVDHEGHRGEMMTDEVSRAITKMATSRPSQ